MSDYPIGVQKRLFPYHVNTTADHWWPKGMQRLWVDSDGYVSRIKPSTEVDRKKLSKNRSGKGFAYKRGGHRVVFGVSPWNHSFEPDFDEIDNKAPPTLSGIVKQLRDNQNLFRTKSQWRTSDTLVKLCFSLLIRSPAFRNRYSFAGASLGLPYNEETGKVTISRFWNSVKDINLANCNSWNLLLLQSGNTEFCYGDGLYDSVFTRSVSWRTHGGHWVADLIGDALVPLLPYLCAYIHFMRDDRRSQTKGVQVTSDIVEQVNAHTQIYSKDQLFFRSSIPSLSKEYIRDQHMMISRGNEKLISALRSHFR